MKFLNSHLNKLYRSQNFNRLTISCHLNHSLAQKIPPLLITGARIESLHTTTITNLFSNCTNLKQLNHFYAHIIRIQFLQLYPSSFHFNVVIRSYTKLDSPAKALYVYLAMSRAGVKPDEYTIPIVLKAANQNSDYVLGKQIHGISVKCGLESQIHCESGLISLYFKAEKSEDALKLFDRYTERKLGSWNAVIGGLSQSGRAKEAINMFIEMMKTGIQPDDITVVTLTSACGSLGDLNLALQLHKCVIQAKNPEKSDTQMMNSLIDMYGKCGKMDLASKVFSRMEVKNVSSWTSMIVGYASHGHVKEALECFHCMRELGVKPNYVTFVGVLMACVHGGLVEDGKYYFNMMRNEYGIRPMLQHYGCMVDLLGRVGMLNEAKDMVETMPMKVNVVIWGCLMGACEKFGNVIMGEWVAKHLIELEPWNDGVYVVLSNIYASNGMWKEVERIREMMKNRKLSKVPSYSLPGVEYGSY